MDKEDSFFHFSLSPAIFIYTGKNSYKCLSYDFSITDAMYKHFWQMVLHLSCGGFCLIRLNFVNVKISQFGNNLPHLCKILYWNYIVATGSPPHRPIACPANVHWNDGGLDRDLYIQINEVTVLAMDGRKRWLDIQKLVFAYCFFDTISKIFYTQRKSSVEIVGI